VRVPSRCTDTARREDPDVITLSTAIVEDLTTGPDQAVTDKQRDRL
jgi:hypothetical protein